MKRLPSQSKEVKKFIKINNHNNDILIVNGVLHQQSNQSSRPIKKKSDYFKISAIPVV